jgi:hypothetical protein
MMLVLEALPGSETGFLCKIRGRWLVVAKHLYNTFVVGPHLPLQGLGGPDFDCSTPSAVALAVGGARASYSGNKAEA